MENELKFEASKLSPTQQEDLRKKIIREAKKRDCKSEESRVKRGVYAEVAEVCECSYSHVKGTWCAYRKKGITGIKAVKMGRPVNTGKLTEEQQAEIRKIVIDKCPNQLKLKGFLWDREQAVALIKQKYGIVLTVQAMSQYFKKWGMTAQRPRKQNYKQQPEEVKAWLGEEYPAIAERAKKEGAVIHWGDETGCQNECNYVKGYAPKGQTPTLPFGDDKLRVSMISSITNQGKCRYMFYNGSFNAALFLQFIKRLVKDSDGRKTILIIDNLRVHHARIVKDWVQSNEDKIELIFLPRYSPELNPDEYLNGNLKREMAKKGTVRTVKQLESNARGIMKKFQFDKEHIASFFMEKHVRYAS
jgi:transposase